MLRASGLLSELEARTFLAFLFLFLSASESKFHEGCDLYACAIVWNVKALRALFDN